MKIYIDSACNIFYSSFYIKGLKEYYGKNNLYFRNKPFKNLKYSNLYLAFIIKNKSKQSRIIIDYADSSKLDLDALKWTDYYYKIKII